MEECGHSVETNGLGTMHETLINSIINHGIQFFKKGGKEKEKPEALG